jgi:hypothetical protein
MDTILCVLTDSVESYTRSGDIYTTEHITEVLDRIKTAVDELVGTNDISDYGSVCVDIINDEIASFKKGGEINARQHPMDNADFVW